MGAENAGPTWRRRRACQLPLPFVNPDFLPPYTAGAMVIQIKASRGSASQRD